MGQAFLATSDTLEACAALVVLMFWSQNIFRNFPMRQGVVGCLTTKDFKFFCKANRVIVSDEKFALQGVPFGTVDLGGISEKDRTIVVGNMFNLFSMSVVEILVWSCMDWDFAIL